MSEQKEERLRQDLLRAWTTRAAVYVEFLKVLKEELGLERAKEIFKRATYNFGRKQAERVGMPDTIKEIRSFIMSRSPDDGRMFNPKVVSMMEDNMIVKFPNCPLKEAWRQFGLTNEEVAEMCEVADYFDHGYFGSRFDYDMKLWSTQPDDACLLIFSTKGKKGSK